MRFGIVIASRFDSARIPGKPLRKINGLPLIEHLLRRCIKTGLPVTLAIPPNDLPKFQYLKDRIPDFKFYLGYPEDPLGRLAGVSRVEGLDAVIRVCHDKIFIEPELIQLACEIFERKNLDYLYSSQFTAGSGFEIISRQALHFAATKYSNVEHVSYAIKNLTKNSHCMDVPAQYRSQARFLIDYPDDLQALDVILSACGQDCGLIDAIRFVEHNLWVQKINLLPKLTVYTCAYNAEKYIEKCVGSVAEQLGFRSMEYILIDDHSTDSTPLKMARLSTRFPNIRFIRNSANLGLASASNVALHEARGEYILRLDADDYLVGRDSLDSLLTEIQESGKDAIYPNNYFGSLKKVQNGKDQHHIGGAIFRRGAVNHVKFTEMLRGYEGLDFFLRAKDQLNIGYYGKPTFFYRQSEGSMSKTNLAERAKLRQQIEERHAGP